MLSRANQLETAVHGCLFDSLLTLAVSVTQETACLIGTENQKIKKKRKRKTHKKIKGNKNFLESPHFNISRRRNLVPGSSTAISTFSNRLKSQPTIPHPTPIEKFLTLPSVLYGRTLITLLSLSLQFSSWVTRTFGFLTQELTGQAQDPGKFATNTYLSQSLLFFFNSFSTCFCFYAYLANEELAASWTKISRWRTRGGEFIN